MKLYLSLLFIFLIEISAIAQQPSTNGLAPDGYCVSDHLHALKLKSDKSYALKTQSTNEAAHRIQTQGIGHRTSAGVIRFLWSCTSFIRTEQKTSAINKSLTVYNT